MTKSIEGPVVDVDEEIDDGEVDDDGVFGMDGKDGRGKISAVGTGRVFKSRSASVMRARIFSIPNERAVAAIAALFASVRTDIGARLGFGNTIGDGVIAGC